MPLILIIAMLFGLCFGAARADTTPDATPSPEFHRTHTVDVLLKQILDAGAARDIAAESAVLDAIQTCSGAKDEATYDLLMRRLCESLTTTDFGSALDNRMRALLEAAAQMALATHPAMPVEAQAYFVSLPMASDEMLDGGNWEKRRSSRVSQMVDLWAKFGASVPAPVDQAGESGLPASKPGEIQTAVKAYIESTDGRNEMSLAQADTTRKAIEYAYYAKSVEAYITASYSRAPYNIAQLRQTLAVSCIPKEVQWRILGKVLYAMRLAEAAAN